MGETRRHVRRPPVVVIVAATVLLVGVDVVEVAGGRNGPVPRAAVPPISGPRDPDTTPPSSPSPPSRHLPVAVRPSRAAVPQRYRVTERTTTIRTIGAGGSTGPSLPTLPGAEDLTPHGSDSVPTAFPDAETTGVPASVALVRYTGPDVVDTPGTVIDGALILGCLVVQAENVTIRNSKIICMQGRGALSFVEPDGDDPVLSHVDHVEIDGRGVATVGIGAKNVLITALDVHGTGDGVHMGADSTLEDSYVHDLGTQPLLHHDAVQTLSGSSAAHILVHHCTLLDHSLTSNGNSVYHLGTGPISHVEVSDNYMDGGQFSIEVGNVSTQHDIVVERTTFGFDYHYGIYSAGAGDAVTFAQNVFVDGGAATPENSRGRGLGGL